LQGFVFQICEVGRWTSDPPKEDLLAKFGYKLESKLDFIFFGYILATSYKLWSKSGEFSFFFFPWNMASLKLPYFPNKTFEGFVTSTLAGEIPCHHPLGCIFNVNLQGQSKPSPTSALWRMDDVWTGNAHFCPLVNHGY
jgi:hypothetical protein